MQVIPDEPRPSLARMLSCRHSRKVSCETLSSHNVLLHCNPQFDAQSFSYSDGERDPVEIDIPAEDADEFSNPLEDPSSDYCKLAHDYLQHVRELENFHSAKLDNPSYGGGKAAGHNFLSRFFSKASHMPAASRIKDVERLRTHVRKHPGAIRHTGGVLPHSAPILLQIGSFSGAPSSRASPSLRASSLILRNVVSDKMAAAAREPFSPKVSCLGRVKNKEHLSKCTSVTSKYTRENQASLGCTSALSRRKKTKEEVLRKEKKAPGKAMVGDHPLTHREKGDRDKAFKTPTSQSSGDKGSTSSRLFAKKESQTWSMRENMKHGESIISHQHQESRQRTEASAPGAYSVDFSRFGSESQRRHASIKAEAKGLVGNGSQRLEQDDEKDFVQAPPQHALLMIRGRKSNNLPEVASSSRNPAAVMKGQKISVSKALDDHAMIKTAGTQFYVPTSVTHTCADDLLPLPEVEMKQPRTSADTLGLTSFIVTPGASASATLCEREKFQKRFFLPAEHAGGHKQASFPKVNPEASLWQRRAIEQPCSLNMKRPITKGVSKAGLNCRTTT